MRIATWNVNSLRARASHLERFVEEVGPDVLCLQELKIDDPQIPFESLHALGYPHVVAWGQPTYNGVALLSRHPITDPQRGLGDYEDDAARAVSGMVEGVWIYSLYAPNGQAVGSAQFSYKLAWLAALRRALQRHTPSDDVLVCGDLNIAPGDLDVWDPFKAEGRLLCTDEERRALQELLDWGLFDSFRERNLFESAFTWWDYRRMGFSRNQGLRIDHVLLTRSLMDRCTEVTIHRDVRGWDTPSDHAPVSVVLS
ncbi:MAG TPA: exodeoxyribonuclease III [Deltaproteobacteria bacterium]|nr:exodeoxyribonuclease III [Deltaproteobacteria bacterium]